MGWQSGWPYCICWLILVQIKVPYARCRFVKIYRFNKIKRHYVKLTIKKRRLIMRINTISLVLSFAFLALTGIHTLVFSQATQLTVEVKNFQRDTVLLAYFYGEKQYIADTAVRNSSDKFVFKPDSFYSTGLYLIVLPPDNQYTQIILTPKEDNLTVALDAGKIQERPQIKGSPENQIFWDYLDFLTAKNAEATSLKQALAEAPPIGQEKELYQRKLEEIDQEVKTYQKELVDRNKNALAAAIVRANIEVELPEFSGEKQEADKKRFYYYRSHYFDNLDLSDNRLLRTPVYFDKVDRFINKYTVQHPDSIIQALDFLLTESSDNPETFKFLLVHFLNEYASSKFVGTDAMYVHLVDNYYARGLAPWVEQEQLQKMMDHAATLRPLLIGKIAPDIKVYKQDLTPISLHDVKARYTILFFWAPDCGHCKKSMPDLVKFYEQYKDKGVEIFAVCTKLLEKEASCWEAVEEKGMVNWINTSDKYLRSKFGQVYNVKSTPQVYVLDSNKEILTKQVAVEKLGEMMEIIIKEEAQKQ